MALSQFYHALKHRTPPPIARDILLAQMLDKRAGHPGQQTHEAYGASDRTDTSRPGRQRSHSDVSECCEAHAATILCETAVYRVLAGCGRRSFEASHVAEARLASA